MDQKFVCVVCRWFSLGTPVSTIKTDRHRHDINEIMFKVALKFIDQTKYKAKSIPITHKYMNAYFSGLAQTLH